MLHITSAVRRARMAWTHSSSIPTPSTIMRDISACPPSVNSDADVQCTTDAPCTGCDPIASPPANAALSWLYLCLSGVMTTTVCSFVGQHSPVISHTGSVGASTISSGDVWIRDALCPMSLYSPIAVHAHKYHSAAAHTCGYTYGVHEKRDIVFKVGGLRKDTIHV